MATNFLTKLTITRLLQKDNCTLFLFTPYFQARAMQWCDVNFSPEDPCCHGNQRKLAAGSQDRQTLKHSC